MITIDSLRNDHVSWSGYERKTTPNLDSVAADSRIFTNAFSQSNCTPFSFLSILGGVYPLATNQFHKDDHHYPMLSAHFPIFSEQMQTGGYATVGIHTNPFLTHFYGYDRGWDMFFDATGEGDIEGESKYHKRKVKIALEGFMRKHRKLYFAYLRARDQFFPIKNLHVPARPMTDRAIKAISDWKEGKFGEGKPLFLWVHYMDVHIPYVPSVEEQKRFLGKSISMRRMNRLNRPLVEHRPELLNKKMIKEVIDLYDTKIFSTDLELGRLFDVLKEEGLYDDSIIIATADHGDEFLEHGNVAHWKGNFYDELTNVPLFIKGLPKGKDDSLRALIDLPYIVADMTGVERAKGMMGVGLDEERKMVFSERSMEGGARMAVRTASKKFIWFKDDERKELYDLSSDQGEEKDLSAERTEGVEAMTELLEHHHRTVTEKAESMRIAKAMKK